MFILMDPDVSQLCVLFWEWILWIVIFEQWEGKFCMHDHSLNLYRIGPWDKWCVEGYRRGKTKHKAIVSLLKNDISSNSSLPTLFIFTTPKSTVFSFWNYSPYISHNKEYQMKHPFLLPPQNNTDQKLHQISARLFKASYSRENWSVSELSFSLESITPTRCIYCLLQTT